MQAAAKQGHTKSQTILLTCQGNRKENVYRTYISEFNIVYRIKTIEGPIKEFQDLVDNEIYVYIFFIGRCFPLKIITY